MGLRTAPPSSAVSGVGQREKPDPSRPSARTLTGSHPDDPDRKTTPGQLPWGGFAIRPAGFEPTTSASGGQRSIQLSYGRNIWAGARNKPSSVPSEGEGSFLWDRRCCRPRAAYPGLGRGGQPLVPYLALLRVGFAMRPLLPGARCALTAPFHPCLCPSRAGHRRSALCGTFRRLATPGRYPAPCPAELGLSSSGRSHRRSSLATLPTDTKSGRKAGFHRSNRSLKATEMGQDRKEKPVPGSAAGSPWTWKGS